MTKPSFEETLIEVWRQALVENAKAVKVSGESYPVRPTPKRGLRQVDFTFAGGQENPAQQFRSLPDWPLPDPPTIVCNRLAWGPSFSQRSAQARRH